MHLNWGLFWGCLGGEWVCFGRVRCTCTFAYWTETLIVFQTLKPTSQSWWSCAAGAAPPPGRAWAVHDLAPSGRPRQQDAVWWCLPWKIGPLLPCHLLWQLSPDFACAFEHLSSLLIKSHTPSRSQVGSMCPNATGWNQMYTKGHVPSKIERARPQDLLSEGMQTTAQGRQPRSVLNRSD